MAGSITQISLKITSSHMLMICARYIHINTYIYPRAHTHAHDYKEEKLTTSFLKDLIMANSILPVDAHRHPA